MGRSVCLVVSLCVCFVLEMGYVLSDGLVVGVMFVGEGGVCVCVCVCVCVSSPVYTWQPAGVCVCVCCLGLLHI